MTDSILRLRVQSEEYDNKLKRASDGIQRYAQKCREVGGTLEVVEKETLDFVKSLGRMETVSKTAKGSLSEMTKAFTDLKMQYKQLTDAEKQSPFGQELSNSLNQLKSRIIETKNDLKGIEGELNGSKFGQFGSVIDTIGHKLGLTTNATELLTSKTALMYSGIGAGIAIIGKATQEWAAYNAELAKQDQITTVTTGLKDDDAKRMTDTMRALSDTYNVDFRDAINAANTLMSQFGVSGDEAIRLIKDGMKGMIYGDGGKLLSMIQQYAPAFQSAGVSASQLVAVIHNSEGGIFTDQNMNAIVMGIKNIRLMTKSTSEALAKLGLDGQDMAKKMSNGSMTVFDALKIVASQLKNVDSNSQAAGEVMQQVFGRQGAMAGTNLAKAIDTLNTNLEDTKKQLGDVGDAYDKLQEANERLNVAIRDAFGYDGWDQMATGIKSKLVTALATVIEQLGEIRQWFSDFTPEGQTNNTQNAEQKDMNRRLAYVRSGSNKQYWHQQNKEYYDQQVSERKYKVLSLRGDDSITRGLRQKAEADLKAWQNLRDEYNKKANEILTTPPKTTTPRTTTPTNPTNPTTTTTNTSHVKTEEQKNNEQIQKLTQEYLKATDERRASIRAEIKDLQDRNKEIKRLTDEAQGIKIGDGSLPALTRQLQEFQQQQSQSANGKEWDEYQKKIDATNDKINVLRGNLPKDKQATFTMNVNAEQLEQLRARIPANSTIKVNVEQGKVDLPSVPTDDKTIKVNITADTAEAMKQVRDLTANIEGTTVKIEPKVEIQEQDIRTPFQKLQDSIKLELSANNVEVDKNTLKSLTEVVTKYDIQTGTIDMRSVIAQAEELTKSGMTAGESYSKALQDALAKNLDLSSIQQQIGEQINIPDETWQALQDQINEKLKELGIEPIKIDFKTGNIVKDGKDVAKNWQGAASAISSVGSAMSQIEDPAAKVMGTIAQAIATIALTYAESLKGTFTPWDWIAGAAAGLAQMTAVISAIHSSTGYAEGGMIKGNSYSGDNLMAQGPNGQLIGLNAGEIVLNRAQQGVIAGALQGGGQTVRVVGKLSGESIFICAENWAKRTGKGEFVTWR